MSAATPEREFVPKTHEELGVRLFESPPQGFDPLRASARELRAYGYPPRPDELQRPKAYAQWQQLLSRPLRMIRPEFVLVSGRYPPVRPVDRPPSPPLDPPVVTDPRWSGVVASDSPPSEDVAFVSGQWTVPNVFPTENESGGSCASWVGIGGRFGGGGFGDVFSLIQAGTDQDVIAFLGEQRTTYPRWEWIPSGPNSGGKAISNLAVSPGDVVVCSIWLEPPDTASFFMANLTSRVSTAFVIRQTQPRSPSSTTLPSGSSKTRQTNMVHPYPSLVTARSTSITASPARSSTNSPPEAANSSR